jgi:hypothetical protein
MVIDRTGSSLTLTLAAHEIDLLRLVLKRATFEDTPPGDQRAIMEFANGLLGALGEDRRA